MSAVRVIWVTGRSLDFSVASKWLNNRGEIEIKIHGQSSHRNTYKKDTLWLVCPRVQVKEPWYLHKESVPGRLLWIWRLPSKSLCSLYWVRSGLHLDWKTSGDQGRWIPERDPQDSILPSVEQALQSFNQSQGKLEGDSPKESQQTVIEWWSWYIQKSLHYAEFICKWPGLFSISGMSSLESKYCKALWENRVTFLPNLSRYLWKCTCYLAFAFYVILLGGQQPKGKVKRTIRFMKVANMPTVYQ